MVNFVFFKQNIGCISVFSFLFIYMLTSVKTSEYHSATTIINVVSAFNSVKLDFMKY